jgi:TM2 domain-containing membrane protein YozV
MFLLAVHSFCASCDALESWFFNCSIDTPSPYTIACPKSGLFEVPCVPLVECEGTRSTFVDCLPSEGRSPGTALCLALTLGWAGVDRYYLRYPTIGFFKLFTGGFFGFGWFLDIVLIALRIAEPARGVPYKYQAGKPALIRLSGDSYV